ncbi:CDP-alcohol phosphatidyltransferase family protein [Patescibacteria group bacterium]|nr:CDP-alcohol phosphatidyltransferase family protein [Patescibacteria group bacterium]
MSIFENKNYQGVDKLTIFKDKVMAVTFLKLVPDKITPNQMTIFRFITVPFIAWFLYIESYKIALPLFIVSALSDWLDGARARLKDKVTFWGKKYDPVADKLLLSVAAVILIGRYLNWILVGAIIIPEVIIITVAYYRIKTRSIISQPKIPGKLKMLFQVIGIVFLILYVMLNSHSFIIIAQYFLYASLGLALVSLIKYRSI